MISICFILLLSILTQSYGQVTCASGWVKNGANCYLIRPAFNSGGPAGGTYGTWDQCHAYCSISSYPGATMICVNNAAENDWMRSQYPGLAYWIGYTDMLPYGGGKGTKQYGWITGCSSTYTYWAPGEPNNRGNNEDQVAVDKASGLWYDVSLQEQLYCGCQYKSVLTTTPSSAPTLAPSSGPTSSPTATPSFRPSGGAVTE